MNIWLVFSFAVMVFSGQCFCYKVRMTAVLPRGFRACIPSEKGLELFEFHALISSTAELKGNVTKPFYGLWCYEENDIVLHFKDEIVYRYRIVRFGQTLLGNGIKILQAADFVDESGDSVSTSTVPSYTESSTKAVGFFKRLSNWFKPREQKPQEEANFKNKKKSALPILSATEQGLQHNGDPRLTNIETLSATGKATEHGVLNSFSQTDTNHGAPSAVDMDTQLGVKFESQESSKTEEMKPKSPPIQTVDKHIRRFGGNMNEHKVISVNNTEKPENFSVGVSGLKSQKTRGKAFDHDDHIIPQQPETKLDGSSIEQQAALKISDNPRIEPIEDITKADHAHDVKFEPQKQINAERHHKVIEPYNPPSGIDKNKETERQLIVPLPEMDAPLELLEQVDNEKAEIISVQAVTPKRGLRKHIISQQPATKYEYTSSEQNALSEIANNSQLVPSHKSLNNIDYARTLVTQPAAKDILTAIDKQALSETFDISQLLPNKDNFNKTGLAHTLDVQFEHKSHIKGAVMEPYYVPNGTDQKEKNEHTENRFIVSSSEMDAPPELKEGKISTKGYDEYYYKERGDIININIVINDKAKETACNTSALFGRPNVDTESRVLNPDEGISSSHKSKSCEALLSQEKKLSEAVKSSYQDCVRKDDALENDLIDSKKEARIFSDLLKETLGMISYLKVSSTNKLILKSSIPLTNYEEVLREVILVLLDVKPSKYNIVQCKLETVNILKFELSAYSEKLLLFLNGRIKLPGSNFQLIDYDA